LVDSIATYEAFKQELADNHRDLIELGRDGGDEEWFPRGQKALENTGTKKNSSPKELEALLTARRDAI